MDSSGSDEEAKLQEHFSLSVQDALAEAEHILAARRSSIVTYRPASIVVKPDEPQPRISIIQADYDEFKHLMTLDIEEPPSRVASTVPVNPERAARVWKRMRTLTCVAALGGFLSGYNTGVISGALLPLQRVFQLDAWQLETLVSATIVCAFVSSLTGSYFTQQFGRKTTILAAALIFTIGAVTLFSAPSYGVLVVGELVLGVGIGIESLTSPMYIAETAQPAIRGMLVSAYGFMMCFGQFTAGLVDGVFSTVPRGWRFMFGCAAVPGTAMFLGFLGLPESPTWLCSVNRPEEALGVLQTVRDTDAQVRQEMTEIRENINLQNRADAQPNNPSSLLRTPSTRRALLVGCSLMFLQQFCGANVVMYYSATIYRMSGFTESTAIWLSAFTALAQLIGLVLSVLFVETAGRRPLLILSFSLVALCLWGLGSAFYLARITSDVVVESSTSCASQEALVWDGFTSYCYDCTLQDGCGYCGGLCVDGTSIGPLEASSCPDGSEWIYDVCPTPTYGTFSDRKEAHCLCTHCYRSVGWLPVICMVVYLIVFGIGAAGLPWTVNSEIYPPHCRSIALGISTGTNWLCNLVVSSTFLSISDPSVLTIYGSFWLYCAVSIGGVLWLWYALPETKGLSVEEMEAVFGKKRVKNGSSYSYGSI